MNKQLKDCNHCGKRRVVGSTTANPTCSRCKKTVRSAQMLQKLTHIDRCSSTSDSDDLHASLSTVPYPSSTMYNSSYQFIAERYRCTKQELLRDSKGNNDDDTEMDSEAEENDNGYEDNDIDQDLFDSDSNESEDDFGHDNDHVTMPYAQLNTSGNDYTRLEQNNDDETMIEEVETEAENSSTHYEIEHRITGECRNCHRRQIAVASELDTTLVNSSTINTRRKFATFSKLQMDTSGTIILCKECKNYLTLPDQFDSTEYMWPAFMYGVFCSVDFSADAWRIVPSLWRHWWLHCFNDNNTIDIDTPVPMVVDISSIRHDHMQVIEVNTLQSIINELPKRIMPTVLCPWGDAAFLNHVGTIALDLILALKVFPSAPFKMMTKMTDIEKVTNSWDGFLFRDRKPIYHLLNPDWEVIPSVMYVQGRGPCFATCPIHSGGNKQMQLFPPASPFPIIAAARPDQLAHVCLKPRLLSGQQRSVNNIIQETVEQRGDYGGIDTCCLTDFGNFGFTSHLSQRNESLSLAGRKDIRSLLRNLNSSEILSSELMDSMVEASFKMFGDGTSLEPYKFGSTFVTLTDTIKAQKMLSFPQTLTINMQRTNGTEQYSKKFLPKFPLVLLRVHSYNGGYGSRFGHVPPMQGSRDAPDKRLLWMLTSMMVTIDVIWDSCVHSLVSDITWIGWMLTFCAKDCLPAYALPKRSGKGKHPFAGLSSQKKILERLPLQEHFDPIIFAELLDCVQAVDCLDGSERQNLQDLLVLKIIQNTSNESWNAPKAVVVTNSDLQYMNHDSALIPLHITIPTSHERDERGVLVYELRFIALSRDVAEGTIYVRHGTSDFPKFWKMDRTGNRLLHSRDSMEDIELSFWQIVVYVKEEFKKMTQLRDEYLRYMGGQTKVHCKKHNLPLIITIKQTKDNKLCCCYGGDEICNKRVQYSCITLNCVCAICKDCMKKISEESHITLSIPNNIVLWHQHRQSQATNSVALNPENESIDDQQQPQQQDVNRNFIDDLEHEVVAISTPQDDFFLTNEQEELDQYAIPSFLDDDDCTTGYEHDVMAHVPQTNSAVRPIKIQQRQGNDPTFVPGHVIMNQCGTLLIRNQGQLSGTLMQQHFLQKAVSTAPNISVPIAYMEGMMHPTTFWASNNDHTSVLGAIPSATLCQASRLKQMGFVSLRDHMRSRLLTPASLTSTDTHYTSWAYDTLCNTAMNGVHSRVVMNRGFTESNDASGLTLQHGGDCFLIDTMHSKQIVHNLCASEKEEANTLFATITCNQNTMVGVKIVKHWIDDPNTLLNHYEGYKHLSPVQQKEVSTQFQHAGATLMFQIWMEVKKIIINYIENSDERPCGHVLKIFDKSEFQDGVRANMDHIHLLLCTKEKPDHPEDQAFFKNLIRGTAHDLIFDDEIDSLIAEGLLSCKAEAEEVREDGRRLLPHHCNQRCMRCTGPGPNDYQCRVFDSFNNNPTPYNHVMKEIDPQHSSEVIAVLSSLGLCNEYDPNDNSWKFQPTVDCLKKLRHIPPCKMGEKFSACNGRLFTAFRCNMNIQICTSYTTNRYVTKYLGEIDKVNNTIVAMSSVNPHQASIQINFLHNTKVSSSSYNEQNKQSMQRDKKFPQARSIGMFEIRQQMLGYPTTHTNVTYVSVPTVALEMRRGIKRKLPVDKINNNRLQRELPRAEIPEDLQDDEIGILKQRNLMVLQWRQHKPREIRMIKDIFFSPISEDKMTMFSLRPPELKIVRNVQVYWRMFSRGTVSISNGLLPLYLDVNSTEASCWIDGLAHQIMLRVGAIHMICEYAQSSDFQASNGYEAIFDLFNKIKTEFDCFGIIHDIQETRLRIRNQGSSEARLQKWYEMQSRFVDVSTDKLRLPVVVISNVKPKFPIQFLYHVLLSMGKFDNEFDITIQPTMREAFREAGLLDYNITSSEENQQIQLQQSLDKLLRAYIFEQLLFYPVSTRSFDYYLMFAANIFKSYLLDDNMPILDLPPVLYTAIQKQSDENTQKYIFGIRESVIEATLREMRPLQNEPNFPTKRELLDATVNNRALCRWTGITTEASPTQSPDSFEEQNELQSLLRQKIDTYCAASLYQTKNLLITGAPGCGKTYNLCYCMLYGLSQGLFMMSTALLADRANVMGGIHMHKMCHMAPKKSWTVQMIADNAIRKIICNPLSLALINSIDALCFDELGNISTQLFSAIEIIFRTVRNNNLLFGGVLVIASIDTQQIKTIDGLPVMLSSFIISSFSAFVLRNSVRAADDEHLQRLITLSRLSTDKYKQDPRLLEEVRWIIKDKCTHVSDWSSPEIPISAYRMFGTRNATRLAERNFLSCLTVPSVVRQSDDVELPAESHGEWMVASTSTVGQLNHCVREPEELTLFKFGVYEFTHNKTGCYNQSQLCVLCNVPTRNHVTTWQPFQVIAAPPGTKFVEFAIESQQQLIEKGWKEITVGPAPERQQTLRNNTRGRRKQYGLRHRIAGTSHGAQGATVGVLVTQISLTKHIYRMWERGQIVVSLSRTNLAKNLIFVNEDIEDTLDAICTLLKTRSQFDEYISEILDVITVNPVTLPSAITSTPPNRMLNLQHHAYRPCDVPFPQDTTGFVYLLVSLRNVNVVYIGSTRRPLGTRLNEHNRGIGSKSTSPAALRPWAVLCYVCGFENQESHMQAFEYAWKARRNASNSHNANDIATLPNRQVMADFPSLSLRTVVMGTLPNLM